MEILDPSFGLSPILLIGLGFCVSFLGGLFGIGGGWILTPVLILLGMPAISAVGTGFPFIFVSSVISLLLHRKARQIDLRTGITLAVAAMAGVFTGSRFVSLLEGRGDFETAIPIVYTVFLALVGTISLLAGARRKRISDGVPPLWTRNDPARTIASTATGLIVGLLSGFLGVGGGLVLFPFLTVVAGFSPALAAGTSLIGVWLSSLAGSAAYLFEGRIAWAAFFWLILPATPASWLGVKTSRVLSASLVKPGFAILVLIGSAALLLKIMRFSRISVWLLFGGAGIISLLGIALLIRSVLRDRKRKPVT